MRERRFDALVPVTTCALALAVAGCGMRADEAPKPHLADVASPASSHSPDEARAVVARTANQDLGGFAGGPDRGDDAAADVAQQLGALTGEFEQCLQQMEPMGQQPESRGLLTLHVAKDGTVAQADTDNLRPPSLASCISNVAKKAKFRAFGVSYTLRIPVRYVPR